MLGDAATATLRVHELRKDSSEILFRRRHAELDALRTHFVMIHIAYKLDYLVEFHCRCPSYGQEDSREQKFQPFRDVGRISPVWKIPSMSSLAGYG